MGNVEIPQYLINQIKDGKVVLFLGSGASIGAKHPKNKSTPTGEELGSMIAKKFLGENFSDRPLSQVAELAISESDLLSVQSFIASQFSEFEPSDFHRLIPKFVWAALATTNYDLIIEKAYDQIEDRLQTIEVFKRDGERVEEK